MQNIIGIVLAACEILTKCDDGRRIQQEYILVGATGSNNIQIRELLGEKGQDRNDQEEATESDIIGNRSKAPDKKPPDNKPPRIIEDNIAKYAVDGNLFRLGSTN